MTTPFQGGSYQSDEARDRLNDPWRVADGRHGETPRADADSAAVARWKELHDREREARLFYVMERAVFRGTIKAHLTLALIGAVVWIAIVQYLRSM